MTEEVKAHETSTSMVKPAPSEVHAGAHITLKVEVSCPEFCDLRGSIARIVNEHADGAKRVELTQFDGTVNQTDHFVVKAPIELGGYTWTAIFPGREKEGVLHEESSTPYSFIVKPHATSIAVWDVPSPTASGDEFRIKVGVKCSAECKLTDKEVEIYDHEGAKVATVTLGDVPWSATSALYWAEVELGAPGAEGYYAWTVGFPKPDLGLPHEDVSYEFGFTTASPPEHLVTVEVTDKRTKAPIKGAYVVVQPYRGHTDEGGVATLEITEGKHELYVSIDNYATFHTTIEATGDVTVKAEMTFFPEFF